jgi:hypothetical protein
MGSLDRSLQYTKDDTIQYTIDVLPESKSRAHIHLICVVVIDGWTAAKQFDEFDKYTVECRVFLGVPPLW